MKKNIISVKPLSIALLCVLVALIPSLTSCREEKSANVSDLLSTVPSSAGAVVGFNLASLLEKAGCKVEGSTITPGKELEQILSSQTLTDGSTKEIIKMLLSGDSGIDPIGALIFTDAYHTYLTAALADTDKFCNFVEQQTGTEFENVDGKIKVSGPIAVNGAQMWMALGTSTSIDTKAIQNYSSLDQAQSFVSLPVASDLSTMTHDIVGYGQIKNFTKSFSMRDAAQLSLVTGFLFENPSALSFHIDFFKGEAKAKAMVLNDKYQPAKYLLPGDKIDVDDVKALSQNANMIFAMAISKDLVKKLNKIAEGFGAMADKAVEAISSLDGTTALAISEPGDYTENYKAIISTNGNPPMDLMSILSQFGNIRKEDKKVVLSNGIVTGSLDVSKMADKFKGATIGTVANLDNKNFNGHTMGIRTVCMTLNPENGSLALNGWIDTPEPDVNALLTILKQLAE